MPFTPNKGCNHEESGKKRKKKIIIYTTPMDVVQRHPVLIGTKAHSFIIYTTPRDVVQPVVEVPLP